MKTALIVIDAQSYFINQHTSHLPQKIASHITQNKYDFVLFTKFVNSESSNFSRSLGWTNCSKSPHTNIASQLSPLSNPKNTFEKSTFSAFKSQKLLSFLQKNKISKVFLCGTDTEACVLASAFDAFDLGYQVVVLKDLCTSCNGPALHNAGISIIERSLERQGK